MSEATELMLRARLFVLETSFLTLLTDEQKKALTVRLQHVASATKNDTGPAAQAIRIAYEDMIQKLARFQGDAPEAFEPNPD